jgi:FecR protein
MKLWSTLAGGVVATISAGLFMGLPAAWAQDGYHGYHIGEQGQNSAAPASDEDAPPEANGPVRMARFSYLNGSVTWRTSADLDWSTAALNTPMREGAQVWVSDGGRAEIQFDDGSALRLGSGAVVTLQTMYSDTKGEFTEIKITDGLGTLDLRTDHSIYQLDTPHGTIKSVGPSMIRLGVDDDVEVGVREGKASLEGPQGKVDLKDGDYVDVTDDTTPFAVAAVPPADSWDDFVNQRHTLMTHDEPKLPENVQVVGGDLDSYGTWQNDPDDGSNAWVPNEPAGWQPYEYGNWTWVEPVGWTWVGVEPWGWAPYHYGTWVHRRFGWGWVPGPVHQYWSPAVVNFSYYDGDLFWAPLAPWEVHYPDAFALGSFGPGWGVWFSIGFCGVYSPANDHWCEAHRFSTRYVNRGGLTRWSGWGSRPALGASGLGQGATAYHFVPAAAQEGGVLHTSAAQFGHAGGISPATPERGMAGFSQGKTFSTQGEGRPRFGPSQIAPPSRTSWSATSSFTSHARDREVTNRPVYRSRTLATGGSAVESARQSFGYGGYHSTGGAGPASSNATHSSSSKGSWSVGDHSGWSHVHSSGGSSGSSSGGSSGGNGGHGH